MYLIRVGKLYLNLDYLIQAEELDEPENRLEIVMERGDTRKLGGIQARAVRVHLAKLRRKPKRKARLSGGRAMTGDMGPAPGSSHRPPDDPDQGEP